jgi:hypothetical protein
MKRACEKEEKLNVMTQPMNPTKKTSRTVSNLLIVHVLKLSWKDLQLNET